MIILLRYVEYYQGYKEMVNLITSYTVLENKEKTFTKYKLSCNWCSFPFFIKVPYVLMKIANKNFCVSKNENKCIENYVILCKSVF